MMDNPEVVREFLNKFDDAQLAKLFPDHNISVKRIKVTNLMTGREVEIDANTPRNCRPDSESYWSS